MAWFVLVQLGLLAVSLISTYYLRPEIDEAKAAGLDKFDAPRAEEGDAVALAYGTVRINAPTVIYFDAGTPDQVPGDGLLYFPLTIRLLLCRSNALVGQTNPPAPQLVGFIIGEQPATLDGPNAGGNLGGAPDGPGDYSYRIDEVSGSVENGRTLGFLRFYDGRWDQARHPDDLLGVVEPSPAVAYRGYLTLFLYPWRIDTPSLPPYAPVIFNPCVIPGYEAQTSPIGGAVGTADCNPAAVIYDILTNPWGGVGNDTTLVDIDSFIAAAEVLEDERHGVSLLVTSQNDARTVIDQILKQIDAVLYQDANRYVLKLIREDYDTATIPEFTVANVIGEPEMSTTLWSDTFNEVRVIFTEPNTGHRPTTATAQDPSGIASNGGRVRSQTIRYPGCRSPDLANRLANRELNLLSRPLATLKLAVNRAGFNLKPGDPFKFTWTPSGFTGVFRVLDLNLGTLDDGRITINAVQDRFTAAGNIFEPPLGESVTEPPPSPDPLRRYVMTEAPRWVLKQAFDQGVVNSPDVQRGYHLAAPEGSDSRYRVDAEIDGASSVADLPARSFPVTFTTSLSYARTVGPYDTATGIVIEDVTGGTLGAATVAQIRDKGRNLIQIGGEILAFEAVAGLGGGSYRLESVWRGLLDTVPADHAAGSTGYLLPGAAGGSAMGRVALPHGVEVIDHMPAAAGAQWTSVDASPSVTLTTRSRTLLPARGAGLTVNGSQSPAALEEDGVALDWKDRDAKKFTIVRGDLADDTLEVGQSYSAVGYKGGLSSAQVEIAANLTDHTYLVPLGKVGHGSIEVGVDARRAVSLPDGTTPTLGGWQPATLPVLAHHWRNLLRNPRFADGLNYWTNTSGTPQVGTATGLGSAGSYLTGSSGTVIEHQDVDITGYRAGGLSAVLDFYTWTNSGDADDTVQVDLIELNAAGSTLATATYGPAVTTLWSRQTIHVAALNASTVTIRVKVTLTPVTGLGPDSVPSCAVTELALRVGQVTAQLLSNPSFEASGSGHTSWTASVGTWQIRNSAPLYDRAQYLRPDDLAAAQLRQSVAIPAGYHYGVAVLECARANDDADDTGAVTLDALDGGGSVVATATTGAEAITPTSKWSRRRLTIDPIPATATQLRVTLDAARVTGTPLNACFDDFDLRCHKHLDPDHELELDWSPVAQPLPRTAPQWKFHFPDVPAPNVAMYDGGPVGRLGIEPLLEVTGASALMSAKAIIFDGVNHSTSCYEGTDGTHHIQTAPSGTAFANFTSAQSFTVVAFWKLHPGADAAEEYGITGRMAGGIGWELRLTATDAFAWARLTGDAGTASAVGTVSTRDASLHGAALIYDAAADTLTLVDASGSTTVSTAAIGELHSAAPARFRIMSSDSLAPDVVGQVPRVYIWSQALSGADVADVLRYKASDPTGLIASDGRTGSIAVVTGEDAAGVVVETFGPGRTAIGYDADADRHGLVTMRDADNLIDTAFLGVTNTGTVDSYVAADPTGFRVAHRITGTNAQGRRYDFTAGTTPSGPVVDLYISWFARADVAHSMRVTVLNAADDVVDVASFAVGTTWQPFTWAATWDDSESTAARVLFSASNDGVSREIYLSPLVCATRGPLFRGALPVYAPGATIPRLAIATLPVQLNREGELVVEVAHVDDGVVQVAELSNGGDNKDLRGLIATATGFRAEHGDSAGTIDSAASVATTAIDQELPHELSLRWNQAATFDGAAVYTQVRGEQGATVETDTGRGATWTASTGAVDQLDLGHADGAAVMSGLVFSARISARERKV